MRSTRRRRGRSCCYKRTFTEAIVINKPLSLTVAAPDGPVVIDGCAPDDAVSRRTELQDDPTPAELASAAVHSLAQPLQAAA